MNKRNILLSSLCFAGGIACYWMAFPPVEFAVAGWAAPLLWLIALRGRSTRFCFWGMYLTGYLAVACGTYWLGNIFSYGAMVLWAILGFYFALWGALTGSASKWPARVRAFWSAGAFCAAEYFRGELAPLCFSWLSLGFSQQNAMGSSVVAQIGVYGMGGLMVLWAGLAVYVLFNPDKKKRTLLIVLWIAIPCLALIPIPEWHSSAIGSVYLQQFTEETAPGESEIPIPAPTNSPDLIVWPEYTFFVNPFERSASWCLEIIRPVAAQAKWGMIVGAIDTSKGVSREQAFRNTAFFFSPKGETIGKAVKNQPIQLFQDGLPAKNVTVLSIPGTASPLRPQDNLRMGIGVCYDGIYQRFARRMMAHNPDFLVFPTMNKQAWGSVQHRQHQRMFQTRAAETRLPVLVAAFSGPTFIAFPNGRASETLPFDAAAALALPIPHPGNRGIFAAIGWWIGPACLIVVLLTLLTNAFQKARRLLAGSSSGIHNLRADADVGEDL